MKFGINRKNTRALCLLTLPVWLLALTPPALASVIEVRAAIRDAHLAGQATDVNADGSGNELRDTGNKHQATGMFDDDRDHRAAVVMFRLPVLPEGQRVATADLGVFLASSAGSPTFAIDLWATRVSPPPWFELDKPGPSRKDYGAGPGPFDGETRIMRRYGTPDTTTNEWLRLDNESQAVLGRYLREHYAAGHYVAFRLTADVTAAQLQSMGPHLRYVFNGIHAETVTEGGDGTQPVLTLTTEPGDAGAKAYTLAERSPTWTVPGAVRSTWLGNTFKGQSDSDVRGKWVQNSVAEIEVTPGGTVLTASGFDENGRCVSLYREGDANHTLFKQYEGGGGHVAWGFGTSSDAVAYDGGHIFIANTNGDLMRFSWEPDKLDSQKYLDQVRYAPGDTKEDNKLGERKLAASALSARNDRLALLQENGTIQFWKEISKGMSRDGELKVEGARDLHLDPDGTLWIASDERVTRMSAEGKILAVIEDAGRPVSVSVSPQGYIVIADNGPRQQVRVYENKDKPALVRTYGREAGLQASDPPGRLAPDIFYSLRGANYDEAGNLYVAFSMGQLSNGAGTTIRSYAANSEYKIRWDLKCLAFVDCFDVDPASDGTILYSSQEIVTFDSAAPDGAHWTHKAMTVDPVTHPDEKRDAGGIQFQRIGERRMFALLSQGEGVSLFAFPPDSDIARPVYDEPFHSGGWGWHLDAQGSLWASDSGDGVIRRWQIKSWDEKGMPVYDRENPEKWPNPEGWKNLQRIFYEPTTDTLYLTGYTEKYPPEKGWGMVGRVVRRYDEWTTGKPTLRYAIEDLPQCNYPLPPKSMDVAGDYIFLGACFHTGGDGGMTSGKPLMVHVYRADNGKYVGNMWGPWLPLPILDTRQAINAFKRSDGQYMIVVEEVFRGKNLVYLWDPPAVEP